MNMARNNDSSFVCNRDPIPTTFFDNTFKRDIDNSMECLKLKVTYSKTIRVYLGFSNSTGTMSHESQFDEGTRQIHVLFNSINILFC